MSSYVCSSHKELNLFTGTDSLLLLTLCDDMRLARAHTRHIIGRSRTVERLQYRGISGRLSKYNDVGVLQKAGWITHRPVISGPVATDTGNLFTLEYQMCRGYQIFDLLPCT